MGGKGEMHLEQKGKNTFIFLLLSILPVYRQMIWIQLLNKTTPIYAVVLLQIFNLEVESICLSLWFILE